MTRFDWIIRVLIKLCVLELYINIHSNTRKNSEPILRLKSQPNKQRSLLLSDCPEWTVFEFRHGHFSILWGHMYPPDPKQTWCVERWLTSVPSAGVCLGHCPMGTRPSLIHLQQKRRMFLLLFSQPFSVLSREVLGWLFVSSIVY